MTASGAAFGAALDGDALVQLTGEAFASPLRALSGSRLRWFDGRSFLGTGNTLSVGPLPPGPNVITLVARDRFGRKGIARTVIVVAPVSLPFLNPNLPRQISPRAQSLVAAPLSNLDATLTVDGTPTQLLAGQAQRVVVPVRPGTRPLLVSMTVDVNGLQIPFAARVRR
jgi:hypothetical protein